jgi:hypothetical protein
MAAVKLRAIREAINACDDAAIIARHLKRALEYHDAHEMTAAECADECADEMAKYTADILCAAERLRRAIIEFERSNGRPTMY